MQELGCEATEIQQWSLDPHWDYSNAQTPDNKVGITSVQQIENGAEEAWTGLLLLVTVSAESLPCKKEIWKQEVFKWLWLCHFGIWPVLTKA